MEEYANIEVTKHENGSRTLRWLGSKNGIVFAFFEEVQNIGKGNDLSNAIEKFGLEEVRRDSSGVYYRRTK